MDFLKWMIEEHPVWLFWFSLIAVVFAACISNFTPIYVLREGDNVNAITPGLSSKDSE